MTALAPDKATVLDREDVAALLADHEGARWRIAGRVDKYDRAAIDAARDFFGLRADQEPDGWQLAAVAAPYESIVEEGNLLTRQGRKRLIDRLVGTASNQALDATHLRIGVGNGTTVAADTDTDLSAAAGSGNRQFQVADSAATVGSGASSGVVTVVATFGTSVGNFHWQEWGIDGGTASGTTVTSEGNTTPGLCNHKVTDLGTKTSAASWVFTITITIT
jgi:hypothetical protein